MTEKENQDALCKRLNVAERNRCYQMFLPLVGKRVRTSRGPGILLRVGHGLEHVHKDGSSEFLPDHTWLAVRLDSCPEKLSVAFPNEILVDDGKLKAVKVGEELLNRARALTYARFVEHDRLQPSSRELAKPIGPTKKILRYLHRVWEAILAREE